MRVLVIEDEHKIANSIKKGLEQERFVVDVVYAGTDGYDLAAGEEYDIIIMDIMLPGLDGVAITRRLREQQIHTPVLMLTAKGQIDDRVNGLDSGADDYVTKPFAFVELMARIRALTRRPKQTSSHVLTVSDLTLDTGTFTVARRKKEIQLSGKEYALLEYLMRHPNQTLNKDQIIHNVWDYDANVLPNTVEVYIKHLRGKIDLPFSGPRLIHTVRGFGYKISGDV